MEFWIEAIGIGLIFAISLWSGKDDKKTTQRYEQMLHEATVKGDQETADRLIQILAMRKSR